MAQKGYFEALQANFSRLIPHAQECGLVIDRLDETGAVASVAYRHEWLGDTDRGLIHTGIVTTLVDTVSGLAALAATGQFEPIATLDLRMDYLRPALIGNYVLPSLHGGVVAGFMENAALLHLLLILDESKVPKGIDFSIDYLRAANAADLHAQCEVARQGRRVAQVQIRCWQDEPGHPGRTREVALARAHFLLGSPGSEAE